MADQPSSSNAPGPSQQDMIHETEEETTVPQLGNMSFENMLVDIRYQIISKMTLKTLNQMRLTSKAVNEYVTSVASGLPIMRNAKYLFLDEKGIRWVCERLDVKRPLHGRCEVADVSRRLHNAIVDCFRIDVPLTEVMVQCLSKARIRVKSLNLYSPSNVEMVNELLSAVRPNNFNYDVSDHSEKVTYQDEGDLKDTEVDVTGLELPRCVNSLTVRAFNVIGFDVGRIPLTLKSLVTTAPVNEMQTNEIVKSWQSFGRQVTKFVLTNACGDMPETDFEIAKALERADPKDIYPEFMLNDRPPSFAIDRGQDQSLVAVIANMKRLVIVGPGNPANTLYKDQRNPRH